MLDQIVRNILVVKSALGTQDVATWIKADTFHAKALFRTIEVVGEASKILSEQCKRQFPTLMISSPQNSDKSLWGKLRNKLHHNKSRSWDIAKLAPEKWAILWTDLLLKLEREIAQRPQYRYTT